MVERIKEIRSRFEEISREKEALHLREEDGVRRGNRGWEGPFPTSHMVDKLGIFGRSNDKAHILDLVLSQNSRGGGVLAIIPIVGMGGIGKTTLAQMIYNDPVMEQSFDLKGWVHVSPEFDIMRLTREILECVTRQPSGKFVGLNSIQRTIEEVVREKRLFLVLDDVWNFRQRDWELLLCPLRSAKVSRIIVTARNVSATEIIQTTHPYQLDCLPEDICWLIFKHHAFGGKGVSEKSSLKQIGGQIIKKCGGLPLVVKAIGGLLRFRSDEDSWRNILEGELWELDGKDEFFPALKLSYHYLPTEMKPCFLFFSLFPERVHIDKELLIYMWMAHGLIQPHGRRRAEDIGSDYFEELHARSLIQSSVRGMFSMHHVIRSLARSMSMQEICSIENIQASNVGSDGRHFLRQTFMGILSFSNSSNLRTLVPYYDLDGVDLPRHFVGSDVRHPFLRPTFMEKLSFSNSSNLETPVSYYHLDGVALPRHFVGSDVRHLFLGQTFMEKLSFSNSSNLRTLVSYYPSDDADLPRHFVDLESMRNLRMLVLSGVNVKRLAYAIGSLKHLRFLQLAAPYLESLPESLFDLYNLETLIIMDCIRLRCLPDSVSNLVNLRCLSLKNCGVEDLPESLCQLLTLQTLDLSDCEQIKSLPTSIGDLINLHNLNLSYTKIRSLPKSFYRLYNLRTLHMEFNYVLEWENWSEGHLCFCNLPRLLCIRGGPYNLTNLEILSCRELESWGALDELKFLRSLVIEDCPKLQLSRAENGPRLPPRLESLKVNGCHSMMSLHLLFEDPSMFLELQIMDCSRLMYIEGLSELTCLETLIISACPHLLLALLTTIPDCVLIAGCPRLNTWCRMHSVQPIHI